MRSLAAFFVVCVLCFPPGPVSASDPQADQLKLSCDRPERSRTARELTIRCDLKLLNRGDDPLFNARVEVVATDGATFEQVRFDFGNVEAGGFAVAPEPLVFSFNWTSQEPPRLEFELSFEDRHGHDRSRQLEL